jgi:hypothetical protein
VIPSSYGPFEVSLTQIQRDQVKRLQRKARELGLGESFIADFRAIVEKLEKSPREWGDPLHFLPTVQMSVYRGIYAKIAVAYGVHARLPIVFVRQIDLVLGHPLAGS